MLEAIIMQTMLFHPLSFDEFTNANDAANSIVRSAAEGTTGYKGTNLTLDFLNQRQKSWQAHLRRISHYLLPGKGVWWKETSNGYQFCNGEDDSTHHTEGPSLRSFRETTLAEAYKSSEENLKIIEAKKIDIPAPTKHVNPESTATIEQGVSALKDTEFVQDGSASVEDTQDEETLLDTYPK